MILTCPDCTTRYRFDEARIPQRGIAVRCKRCRTVFRARRPDGAAPPAKSGSAALASSPPTGPRAVPGASKTKGGAKVTVGPVSPSSPPGPLHSEAAPIPVKVVPAATTPLEEEIRRLTRIILSDIVIYAPEKADHAIVEGRFGEVYRTEIEEGRKMIRSRFSSAPAAVESYERALRELVDARRRELQRAAGAL